MSATCGAGAWRVAVLAPISWRTPPQHYGPWEQFASLLTEGLVERGVDVTLFATADSKTAARLVSVVAHAYSEDPDSEPKVSECLHIAEVFERAAEFDIIHNSFDFLPLTYSDLVPTPVITTIHGFSSARILPVFRKYNARTSYIAISEADRRPELDYLATIHHGIDTGAFTLQTCPGNYLLFFGRIHPDKGAVEAIDVAARAGLPLVMAGIIQDQAYFDAWYCATPRWQARPLHRARGWRGPQRPPWRGLCPPPPRQLRGALRLQRRRSNGLRDAGSGLSTWVDAGTRRQCSHRLPGRQY